ncbi:Hypothetical predicted protein [Cloeon dipterum]|uniref:SH3 domain-containing protein n=1 Tax=Cloeon dipterum TaxID=197152 RepID=A0A8S1D3P4_9INSE|nr:Hypothetical predicted protein [Cloeon dipterum]
MQILAKFLVFSSLLVISLVHARISDLRLCVDENCSVPVSIARSVLSYNSDDARILSFKPSDKIVIYSKSAGSKPDLWGAEINGKRGYVPKDLIREQKILNSNLKFTVPTEQVAQEAEKNPENEASVKPFLPTPVPDTQQELNENDPNVIVVDGTTIYVSEDSDIEKTITTGPPPPPETIPPAPSSETPLQPPTNLNSAKENSIPDQPQEELTTPEPETPDEKPIVEEEEVKTDDSTEAVSEPPEVAKDETVMEYISDTLTGWLDASGEGKQEEVDTGQDVGQSEEVTESVTAEPPEDVQVDLSKINLLSTKGNTQEPEVNEALKVVVDEPPVKTVPSPYPDVEEPVSSDEIYHQYPSSTSLQAEEMASQETSTEVSFNEEDSRPPLSAEDETSSEVPLYSEEVTTESAEVTSPPPEETASEETTSTSQFEILQPLEEQKQEEVKYSPYQNYETGQVVEVDTEKVEEVTTETTLVVEEAYPPVVEDETTVVPYPPLVSEEATPAPAVQEDAAESTTSADSVETTPSADTAETTITEESPQEEATPLERDSGGIFADWVYNLFGSSSNEEATDATPEQVITEKLLAEEPPAKESASSGSWFSFGSTVEPEISTADVTGDACFAESCAQVGSAPNHQPADSEQYHQQHHQAHSEASAMEWDVVASSGTILYLVVTAITVLLFTLGHYFIEKMRRDGALIAKINTLQRELLVSSKECLILKEDLETTKEKLTGIETTTSDSSGAILEIRAELSESQRGSQDLVKSVELLQGQLNKQQATISSMNQTLNLKTQENETLRLELTAANDKILDLELDIDSISKNLSTLQEEKLKLKRDLEENCCTLANQLQEATNLREVEVDAVKKKLDASEASLKEVQNALKHRNSELEVLKESISKLSTLKEDNSDKANRKLEAMLDVSKVQAELKLLISERDVLKERLQCEEDARQLLEDHMKMVKDEVQKLHEKGEAAEKEKQDALTRLEVLSEYFKEKEAQLQKELGLQEAFSVMKNEDFSSTQTRIKSLEEEVENFKAQNETLKQEIIDQEKGLKGQIVTLEKKAHENWIAARQAERKLDESKQESSTLRNRLTMLEKGTSLVTQNGEEGKGAATSKCYNHTSLCLIRQLETIKQ